MKSIWPSEYSNPYITPDAAAQIREEIAKHMSDELPTGNVEYPIDTNAFKTLHVPEIQAQSLVATDTLYNYTTLQYESVPANWFDSGMDLSDYVPVQERAVYADSVANDARPIQAMVDALTFVIDAMKGGDE